MTWLWSNISRIFEYLDQGGLVMGPLLLISVIMWVLIIKRGLYLRRMRVRNMPREMAAQLIRDNQPPDFTEFRGATALVVSEFLKRREANPGVDRSTMDETVMAVASSFDKQLSVITVLASMAPLLGLLGTVLGMISTFDVISLHGTGNARAMAGGISEALISTQTGLLVAIPGLTMKNFLASRAQTLKHRVSSLGIFLGRRL
ncbi:outer membrane transport energization protein ExbB [Desulfatibacillum alkenivorans DSM 16219]|jgi:biopolymer transport protein ExbB|uniref:Outer membrane transport energization protein ExbB n=1 Tax=Desulfatibacillum alkenivorans DSM 16219 TaxID=1121393 RepID=A0A1M6FV19_9BACT|nr:MotA/TolQ/ExbB proton channel family protein [Desulfatibacillum alkenivorans]SHJ01581.1 outer membrane transport energization protein ExbB [Desulfatibacillum alkenivorans DSM 16219]